MESFDYLEVDFLPFAVDEIIPGIFQNSLLLGCGLPFERAVLTFVHKASVTGLESISTHDTVCHGASLSAY
jgi:hypothetical protein